MQQEFITVTFNRTKIAIRCADILYVIMSDDHCTIHMFDGSVYRCRMTLKALKKQLNEGFMEVKRGCMIAVSAISNIGDKILLSNGEEICYTKRKKKALREELQKKQELMIAKISKKKLPLDKMIGNSFSSLFSNMDAKWLHVYERATLYGETLEIMDYSPEIDTNLKIICFPTFPGHCGCILFNADQMKSISEENHLVRLAAVALKSNPTI
ncbi:LytTR family transcriptional regulator [Ruminococcus sp. AF25-23LB]|nr:LytTR family transcriptional regulator [Ruminococcus sp. AF25-23LB]